MNLREIAERLSLRPLCCEEQLDAEITRGYASDLLSDVMAHAEEGDIWVTLQAHQNTVAVAVMKSLAAIVLVAGRTPHDATLAKAREVNIPVLISDLPAFELIGQLYGMGVTGAAR